MHATNEWRQQTVARHAVEHAQIGLTRAQESPMTGRQWRRVYQTPHPIQTGVVRCDRDRIRDVELAVRHNTGRDCRNQNIENGTDKERPDDRNRHVPLRIFCFLRGGADRIKSDIGEEHDPRAGHHTAPAKMSGYACVCGINGCQFAVWIACAAATMKSNTTATFTITMKLLSLPTP